jgi:hypothetical protein
MSLCKCVEDGDGKSIDANVLGVPDGKLRSPRRLLLQHYI